MSQISLLSPLRPLYLSLSPSPGSPDTPKHYNHRDVEMIIGWHFQLGFDFSLLPQWSCSAMTTDGTLITVVALHFVWAKEPRSPNIALRVVLLSSLPPRNAAPRVRCRLPWRQSGYYPAESSHTNQTVICLSASVLLSIYMDRKTLRIFFFWKYILVKIYELKKVKSRNVDFFAFCRFSGTRQSMWHYILTYSRLKRESF